MCALTEYGNYILAGTDAYTGIWYSTSLGQNWVQTNLSNEEIYCFAISGNNIYAGSGGSGVYLSIDSGQTWTQTALNNKTVGSLAVSGNSIFAGTYQNGVYLSTNNGSSWTQTALNNLTVTSLAVSEDKIFAGTYDNFNNTGIFFSTNNGQSWVQKNEGFKYIPGVGSLLILNDYILAGTYGYSVWRRPLSDFTGIQSISTEIPTVYSLGQNYPNPFNAVTKIRFDVQKLESRSQNSEVTLKIFDVLGREVETLVNERLQPGTYETSFDGSGLNSGVYFYKMVVHHGVSSTDGFSETKRMILLK
ncbi:MAG: T9SS type A sorting domain-containing protein [Candidatus Kapaibacterium sp.]